MKNCRTRIRIQKFGTGGEWESETVTPATSSMDRNRTFRSGRFDVADSVWLFRSEPFRSEPFRSGRFGLAVSVTGHFGWTKKSCRYLTLMQSRAVWFKVYSLHHHTVRYQRSRHSTQSVLPSRFEIAASDVGKVFNSARHKVLSCRAK